ncbi:xylose isomerase [Bacteroidia bacterium]|nr:xylose isomerase [Bacteroidia bacterium]
MNTMNFSSSSRRTFLQQIALLGIALPLPLTSCSSAPEKDRQTSTDKKRPFRISLNVSTISGFKIPIEEQIKLSAVAGFEGIELWLSDVNDYVKSGGDVKDLNKLLQDNGLILENIIGFSNWLSNDPQTSAQGIAQMKKDMELTAQLGGHHIAATGIGLDVFLPENIELYGKQFAEIIHFGASCQVTPLLELWGHGILNKLWKVLSIASESQSPDAKFLLDFYHLHAGGNSFSELTLLNGTSLPVFHINDYPGDIPVETVADSDRVYPGDGACPFDEIIPRLYQTGFRGALSLELFNVSYWNNGTPKQVLDTGYKKTVEVIDRALSNYKS